MRKTIFLISLLVLAIFVAGCKEQAGEATTLMSPKISVTSPSMITNLRASVVKPTEITWSWTNPTLTFTTIKISVNGVYKGDFKVNSWREAGLTPNTNYDVSLVLVDKSGVKSPVRNSAKTLPLPDTTPPGPVTDLRTVSVNCNNITWNWVNPVESDFKHCEVRVNGTWVLNSTSGVAIIAGLRPRTGYALNVTPVDLAGNLGEWRRNDAFTIACP
jgi:hypothetical protein